MSNERENIKATPGNEATRSYTEADFDTDMMERINKRHNDQKTAEAGRSKEKTAEYKKMCNAAMFGYTARCAVTALVCAALYRAMNTDLIAPVLAVPVTYIGMAYFGWCLCKVYGFFKKGANR